MVKPNDRYEVKKIGQSEGPNCTTTVADFMKPWGQVLDDVELITEEEDEISS